MAEMLSWFGWDSGSLWGPGATIVGLVFWVSMTRLPASPPGLGHLALPEGERGTL